jgi:hypothetical protein
MRPSRRPQNDVGFQRVTVVVMIGREPGLSLLTLAVL